MTTADDGATDSQGCKSAQVVAQWALLGLACAPCNPPLFLLIARTPHAAHDPKNYMFPCPSRHLKLIQAGYTAVIASSVGPSRHLEPSLCNSGPSQVCPFGKRCAVSSHLEFHAGQRAWRALLDEPLLQQSAKYRAQLGTCVVRLRMHILRNGPHEPRLAAPVP